MANAMQLIQIRIWVT